MCWFPRRITDKILTTVVKSHTFLSHHVHPIYSNFPLFWAQLVLKADLGVDLDMWGCVN